MACSCTDSSTLKRVTKAELFKILALSLGVAGIGEVPSAVVKNSKLRVAVSAVVESFGVVVAVIVPALTSKSGLLMIIMASPLLSVSLLLGVNAPRSAVKSTF